MKILITGAAGFVGKNLTVALENIREGKDRTHPLCSVTELYAYDRDTDPALLKTYCREADFVFHLAGVNRPKAPEEFMAGNFGFTSVLLDTLREARNTCPVLLASSAQASLAGRYAGSEYGKSKLAGEELLRRYGQETGARVLIYRFPNVFGKWCRPNYNSAVATFCYNVAHDLPVSVTDPQMELELVYIDDLVEELLGALSGQVHRCAYEGLRAIPDETGPYCYVPVTHRETLGEIVELLRGFDRQPKTLLMPPMPEDSFAKKLYAAYLSYLPKEKIAVPMKMNVDARGSFTELLRTEACGQISVNISKPGVTKGQHWHNTKWEYFMVVSGHGLIRERRIGTDEILEFEVSGDTIEAVHMLPGYTHSIVNLSKTEDLVTVMWASECFDQAHPDTFREEV